MNLERLKAALALLESELSAVPANAGPDAVGYDLRWQVQCLRSLIKNEWLEKQALGGESISDRVSVELVEAGAKFSASSLATLTQILNSLQGLLEEDKPEQLDEAKTAINSFLAKAESISTENIGEAPDGPELDPLDLELEADGSIKSKDDSEKSARIAWAKYYKMEKFLKKRGLLNLALDETSGESIETVEKQDVRFAESVTVLAEAVDSTPKRPRFRMLVVKEGRSHNRNIYSEAVLREAMPLLNDRPMYVEHPSGWQNGNFSRSLDKKVGWWSEAEWSDEHRGGVATLNLYSKDASPQPWLEGMIRESIAAGHPEQVGVSMFAGGKWKLIQQADGPAREAISISKWWSADAVAEPSAGGEPISHVESTHEDDMDFKDMTLEQLKEVLAAHPEWAEAIRPLIAAKDPPADPPTGESTTDTPPPAPPVPAELPAAFTEAMNQLATERLNMQRERTQTTMTRLLAESKLPVAFQALIKAQIGEAVMAEADIQSIIDSYIVATKDAISNDPTMRQAGGVVVPFRESVRAENGSVTTIAPLDKVIAALDHWFGAPKEETHKQIALESWEKIQNFRQFWTQVTGDAEVDGRFRPERSVIGDVWGESFENVFGEALPGASHLVGGTTITMSSLINLTMNKRLLAQYRAQPQWWRPIVDVIEVNDFKQQTRVRLHNFGALTERTVDGAEYTELDWDNSSEQWTPTEFGNVLSIGRRAIINDDLRGIQRAPALMGQSAIITLNEYVSAMFTVNGGNGPTLGDGVQVFNAGSHQGNRIELPLDRAALVQARRIAMTAVNTANKRIGLLPKWLLVPIELEDVAFELTRSVGKPESANNEPNILSAPQGFSGHILVPNWTDANNWYIMPDRGQIANIEMGFLFGREEPEFFTQNDPNVGTMFTNDVMMYKIRHDYGGGWIDYRGAVASIVA